MITPNEARVVVWASVLAAQYGHEVNEDWERRANLWASSCERCGARVICNPDEGRTFGAAVRARCEAA